MVGVEGEEEEEEGGGNAARAKLLVVLLLQGKEGEEEDEGMRCQWRAARRMDGTRRAVAPPNLPLLQAVLARPLPVPRAVAAAAAPPRLAARIRT